ncbi:MAG: hypothetical protein CMK59_08675 [Proteobacteria bacterium]|nr:hypothetical protein [Pseudomonadota bacterium]
MTSTTWKSFTVQSPAANEAAVQELLSQAINLYLKEMETKGLTLLSTQGLTQERNGSTLTASIRFFWSGKLQASSETAMHTLPSQRSSNTEQSTPKAETTAAPKSSKSSVLPDKPKIISPSTLRKNRTRRSSFSDQRTIVPEFLMESNGSSSDLSNLARTGINTGPVDDETEEGLAEDDLVPPPYSQGKQSEVHVEIEESPLLTDDFGDEDFGINVEDLDQGRFMNKLDFSAHSLPSDELNEPMKTEEKRKNNESIVFLDDPDM